MTEVDDGADARDEIDPMLSKKHTSTYAPVADDAAEADVSVDVGSETDALLSEQPEPCYMSPEALTGAVCRS